MTFFEYVMVMVSLIMALALSHVMRASSNIITNPNRYWVHIVWVLSFLFWILQGWWALWDLRTETDWSFIKYLSMFPFPLLLFVVGSILVPSDKPGTTDWKVHFDEKRTWFFSAMTVLGIESVMTPLLVFDAPLVATFRIFQLAMIALTVIGLVGKSERVQSVVAIMYLLLFVVGNYVGRLQPGVLASS